MKYIRNFCIIAHIDHGKSTLADRLLEITHTVQKHEMKQQMLDQMDLERERGITIKLQPVQMKYVYDCKEYELNLIDTPGHVDFSYEVSRSLAAVEGAVLLIDATKGVQAQTLANLYLAIEQNLEIIPVINKIDLPNAEVEKTTKEIQHILGCAREDILHASGKTGEGVDEIIKEIIKKVPFPKGDAEKPLRAMIFDSVYNTYKGVVGYVRIIDGTVKRGDEIILMATQKTSDVVEVGTFTPKMKMSEEILTGSIGYIATGFKSVSDCRVGDTITKRQTDFIIKKADNIVTYEHKDYSNSVLSENKKKLYEEKKVTALTGYKIVKPVVYASFYPTDGGEYNEMRDALEKLTLNDGAFQFEPEGNVALGRGFRCGFLGLLHLEIIQARLEREFNITPTITTPSVVYKIKKKNTSDEIVIYSPLDLPDPAEIESISEPYVSLDIITPAEYLGSIMELMQTTRAEYNNTDYIDQDRIVLSYNAPLIEVIIDFHDQLKSATSGYASMNYEIKEYRESELVRLDIIIADEKNDAFSQIVPKQNAHNEGKRIVEKLKKVIPRQNFTIKIQAAIGGKVVARETITPYRKDVIAKLYGGDVTRKRKLLDKQKKGKKKMTSMGKVTIPSEVFIAVLRR